MLNDVVMVLNFAFNHQDYVYNWLGTDEKTSPRILPETVPIIPLLTVGVLEI